MKVVDVRLEGMETFFIYLFGSIEWLLGLCSVLSPSARSSIFSRKNRRDLVQLLTLLVVASYL